MILIYEKSRRNSSDYDGLKIQKRLRQTDEEITAAILQTVGKNY